MRWIFWILTGESKEADSPEGFLQVPSNESFRKKHLLHLEMDYWEQKHSLENREFEPMSQAVSQIVSKTKKRELDSALMATKPIFCCIMPILLFLFYYEHWSLKFSRDKQSECNSECHSHLITCHPKLCSLNLACTCICSSKLQLHWKLEDQPVQDWFSVALLCDEKTAGFAVRSNLNPGLAVDELWEFGVIYLQLNGVASYVT